jgi:hypothetical protein
VFDLTKYPPSGYAPCAADEYFSEDVVTTGQSTPTTGQISTMATPTTTTGTVDAGGSSGEAESTTEDEQVAAAVVTVVAAALAAITYVAYPLAFGDTIGKRISVADSMLMDEFSSVRH